MSEYTPAAALRIRRCLFFLGRLSVTTAEPAAELVALERDAEHLGRVKLPIAVSVETTALPLVWLTAGFSVTADRAAAGNYVCGLGAWRSHDGHT